MTASKEDQKRVERENFNWEKEQMMQELAERVRRGLVGRREVNGAG